MLNEASAQTQDDGTMKFCFDEILFCNNICACADLIFLKHNFMKKNGKISEMERLFSALADRTRLRIVNVIGDGEICVWIFTEVLQVPQPKVSRHLAYLRRAGIVETNRNGKLIYYRLALPKDQVARRVFGEIRNWLACDEQMKEDEKRLAQIYRFSEIPPTGFRASSHQNQTAENESENTKDRNARELEYFLL